jgi:transcriptional regulator with XRE-family HTH domain
LPFCHLTLTCKKPTDSKYPTELRTLGDHLRKRRLDLGLLQAAVGSQIGVTACTVKNWELGHNSPETRHLPAIHEFLGYQPFEPNRHSFSEMLRFFRRAAGLSQEGLARRVGFDESTIAKWERGDNIPMPESLDRLRSFFQNAGQQFPGFETELAYHTERRAQAAARAWYTRRAKKSGSESRS